MIKADGMKVEFRAAPETLSSEAPLSEDDLIMLESLVKSPVFGVLKRLIRNYRSAEISTLLSSKNPQEMFTAQGKAQGLTLLENIPQLLTAQYQQIKKARELKEEREKKLKA